MHHQILERWRARGTLTSSWDTDRDLFVGLRRLFDSSSDAVGPRTSYNRWRSLRSTFEARAVPEKSRRLQMNGKQPIWGFTSPSKTALTRVFALVRRCRRGEFEHNPTTARARPVRRRPVTVSVEGPKRDVNLAGQ